MNLSNVKERDMAINDKYSKMYMATVTVENEWGYHLEALWYGADAKNLAAMIMDMMNSWYLPNKEHMSPDIIAFYDKLAAATEEVPEGEKPKAYVTFTELTGEMFKANGLTLRVTTTNNLLDMFKFVANETFEIFATKDEKAEDFANLTDFIEYLGSTYEIDEQLMAALRTPNEMTLISALYVIDVKYNYMGRHYRNQTVETANN
ncbi:MAG: hypothetical protein HUJ98_07930 [Bacteroidaceae bacterium]|nr:hypothetical protein [Bacteroidaceae bacterium]